MTAALETTIEQAWEDRGNISAATKGEVRGAVDEALSMLDSGKARVAEKGADGNWAVHQWLKKAVLLSFRLNANGPIKGGPDGSTWWDKVPSKFDGWTSDDFASSGLRAVPNAVARRGSYIASGVVLMPSFVNIGAYVDEGTMVDTWATVGSCAQIGKNVHLSGGAGIGGVDARVCRIQPAQLACDSIQPQLAIFGVEPRVRIAALMIVAFVIVVMLLFVALLPLMRREFCALAELKHGCPRHLQQPSDRRIRRQRVDAALQPRRQRRADPEYRIRAFQIARLGRAQCVAVGRRALPHDLFGRADPLHNPRNQRLDGRDIDSDLRNLCFGSCRA
jgi:hypothetical protein